MEIITMILGIVLLIIGFGLMDYNMTHDAKHNIATGFFAYMFLLIGFTLIVYRFFQKKRKEKKKMKRIISIIKNIIIIIFIIFDIWFLISYIDIVIHNLSMPKYSNINLIYLLYNLFS